MSSNLKPTVSVIIPVFNGAQYIQGAIESVLNQTFKDFEIIVVDDGSTDDTKALLEPWVKEEKIKYIYQQNKGLAGARNTGIRHAGGKFLKFLDCDDLLYPEQLERQVEHLMDKPQSIISATSYELEFESKKKISINLYLKENQLAQFIEGNPCPAHTILVHRSLVEQAGGFDETLLSHEDSDLWLRILIQGGIFEKVDYLGCCYRIHSGALSDDASKMFRHYCRFSEKLNQDLLPQVKQLPEEAHYQLFYRNIQIIHTCFSQKIKPDSCLSLTLRMTGILYAKRAHVLAVLFYRVVGIEYYVRKRYGKACRIDWGYPKKLLNIPWRDEGFYDRKNFQYFELLPSNKKIKNILYLNSSSVIYGAETRLLDMIRTLDTGKFRPFVLLPHAGPLEERLKELGVVTMHLEYGFPLDKFTKENVIRFLKLNKALFHLAHRYDIDLIHANLHINMSKFWLAFLLLGKPVVVHMRSHFWLTPFERFVISRTFKAIFISRFVKWDFFKKRRSSFMVFHRPDRAEVLHDGIDINHFNPWQADGKIRGEFNIKPDDFLVAIIGAVDKVKGQDLLVEAADIVVKKHPHAKFVIVGDLYHNAKSNTDYRDGLVKFIQDHDLTKHVIFTGFRKDIISFMSASDLLVQPSEREALGTSMVEAMSCGKPVIGTDVDGIPEVIGKNEAGILLNPRTPEAFAEAINFFIEHPEEARRRGQQGRERALEFFNVYENIKHIEEIYSEALKDRW